MIGVGLAATRIPSIFPQPHDIAMDRIVTEAGIEGRAQARGAGRCRGNNIGATMPAPGATRDFPQAHSIASSETLLWHNVGHEPSG